MEIRCSSVSAGGREPDPSNLYGLGSRCEDIFMRFRLFLISAVFTLLLVGGEGFFSEATARCRRNSECASDFCDQGRCRARKRERERCSGYSECASGFCDRGSCRARRTEGEKCGGDEHCVDGFFCDERKCKPRATDYSRCIRYSDCASGFCDRGRCRARREGGEMCSGDEHCANDFYCDGGRCKKKMRDGDSNPFMRAFIRGLLFP